MTETNTLAREIRFVYMCACVCLSVRLHKTLCLAGVFVVNFNDGCFMTEIIGRCSLTEINGRCFISHSLWLR